MKKPVNKILVILALLLPFSAQASYLSIVDGSEVQITGYYNPSPAITGPYTEGTLGKLNALSNGVFSATYLGQESGYNTGFSFEKTGYRLGKAINSQTANYDIALNEYSTIGHTIYTDVLSGILDFWFRDDHGGYVGNDGLKYRKGSSFAILEADKCITTYGCFNYILGFDDSGGGLDRDYDDFVVGVNLSPVPLPAAVWLFASALMGFVVLSNRRKV